jgi:hypothetical protein
LTQEIGNDLRKKKKKKGKHREKLIASTEN